MEEVAVYWKPQKYKGSWGIVMDNYKPIKWITKEITFLETCNWPRMNQNQIETDQ